MSADPHPKTPGAVAALTLAAIGVVYGDIGTSPLYALKEVFAQGRVPLTPDNVLGILSLVFWSLTVIVSLKYVVLGSGQIRVRPESDVRITAEAVLGQATVLTDEAMHKSAGDGATAEVVCGAGTGTLHVAARMGSVQVTLG